MPRCLVPNCPNKYKIGCKDNTREKSFFQVPQGHKNPKKWELAKKWLKFCGIDSTKFLILPHRTICEDHFEPHLIERVNQRIFPQGFNGQAPKRLIKGSVPTLKGPRSFVDNASVDNADAENSSLEANQFNQNIDEPQPTPEKESSVICEKIRCQPKSAPRKEVEDLARWPPDTKVKAQELNAILTCGICKGYFYNATTITECLHTFCKDCLIKHFNVHLHCPTCRILVHPSDPFCCLKMDHTMQDLVYKIFPDCHKEAVSKELDFYTSQGLEPPPARIHNQNPEKKSRRRNKKSQNKSKSDVISNSTNIADSASTPSTTPPPTPVPTMSVRMVSVVLDYIGTSPHLPPHFPLAKNFLRIPDSVTIHHIQTFLKNKMRLHLSCQAAIFVNTSMLHGNLTIEKVERIFGQQAFRDLKDLIVLQFGIIPKGDYFQEGLLISTKDA